ncbi:MAG TPA: four helix bundle protein [Chitinophagales bacterium]|nr:four helix bundle protein [Chitinophagales bacterium]
MAYKFETLRVWQDAMELGEELNDIAIKYPKHEMFNLTSQTMRAVDSIALNVSEGSIGQSNPENRKFVGYAIRSNCEVITCLYKAKNRKYITEEKFTELYNKTELLFKRLNAYRNTMD